MGRCALSTSLAAARRAVCARARACSSRGRSRWLRCSAHGARLCASWQVRTGEAAMGGDEIESGTVRAVPLAGGRSPGRVRSSVRVLESRMLSMAALLGSRRTLVCILPVGTVEEDAG